MHDMTDAPATLAALQAMPIYGNAYHDMPLFRYADRIILDEAQPVADRLKAMDYIAHDVMGMDDTPPADADDLVEYVRTAAEYSE